MHIHFSSLSLGCKIKPPELSSVWLGFSPQLINGHLLIESSQGGKLEQTEQSERVWEGSHYIPLCPHDLITQVSAALHIES